MQLTFSPDDDRESYLDARDDLVEFCLGWAEQRRMTADGHTLSIALDLKHHLDGRFDRWLVDDLRALLLEWFPRKVTMRPADFGAVPPALRTLMAFLDDRKLLAADSDTPVELKGAVDGAERGYLAAMADERRYDIGKFWATRMLEHGIDVGDAVAVQQFVDNAKAGLIPVDEDVLKAITARQAAEESPAPANVAPVRLPTDDELLAAAEGSRLVGWVRAFVDWVGDGRTLTRTGRLTVADGRAVAALLGVDEDHTATARSSTDLPTVTTVDNLVRAVRGVRPLKGRLVPVKSGAARLREPVELWRLLFQQISECEFLAALGDGGRPLPWRFDDTLPAVAIGLYTAGGPVPLESVYDWVSTALDDPEEMWSIRQDDVEVLLGVLEALGATRRQEVDDTAQAAKIAEVAGRAEPAHTLVALTPIGIWAVNRELRAQGAQAPVVGESAGESFDAVCRVLEHASPDVVEDELASWVDARSAEDAADELARVAERTDRPSYRALALRALERTGASGLAAAGRVRAAGGPAGAMAAGWLAAQDALPQSELNEAELRLALADQLAATHEAGLLLEALADAARGVGSELDIVHRLAAADHPMRGAMLDAIGSGHPDAAVAKAARKARLKLRSADIAD
jgi:hypothetical protein